MMKLLKPRLALVIFVHVPTFESNTRMRLVDVHGQASRSNIEGRMTPRGGKKHVSEDFAFEASRAVNNTRKGRIP